MQIICKSSGVPLISSIYSFTVFEIILFLEILKTEINIPKGIANTIVIANIFKDTCVPFINILINLTK